MTTAATASAPGASRHGRRLLQFAYLLLAAWAVGLVVAAVQLGSWRTELSRLLLQLDADAQFRARAHTREAVDPEWYRRKALALLSETERLQRPAPWKVFVPGSWRMFDRLEEQVQGRLEREFADIVVETMRRELHARASQLTGVPLVHGSGDVHVGADCRSPVPQNPERKLTAAAEDLPEFVAVADYVQAVERLDHAVQSFFSLQHAGGRPQQLRELTAYTLNKELPGALEGAVRMFQRGDEVNLQPTLMQSRLQWATRCSLAKAMTALDSRLLNTNDLFALEQGLVERSAGLFEPWARPASFDRTLERYRAVHALLEDQHALLAKGRNDWMRQGTLQLGPAYQEMLQRIRGTRLLGPEVLQQLQDQSGVAFAEFRRQFENAFGSRGEPGVVWIPSERRFGLSPERAALREGLGALLKMSFMAEEPPRPPGKAPQDAGTLAKAVEDARSWSAERTRTVSEIVPRFPRRAQPVVMRVVDARVSELIYQRAYRALKAALPADPRVPLDPVAFRHQREHVMMLRALLKQAGGAAWGDRLVATLDGEILLRLGPLQEAWRQLPLQDLRFADFSWWQGEPLALAPALGAGDPAAPSFSRAASRLHVLVQEASPLLALGGPAMATDLAAARWIQLKAELDRYQAHASGSSLFRLERYVAALGPDFRRENCAERLGANAPRASAANDEIAQRHLQLHKALAIRCNELRTQVPAQAATFAQ